MEVRRIIVTLECFVHKDHRYLMLHRNKDKKIMPDVWMAPGGKREFNEGLFECARREVLEETGLHIKNLQIRAVGNAYLKDINQEIYFTFVFADWKSGEVLINSPDGDLVWLSPDQIVNQKNILAEIKHVGKYIFNENSGVISYIAVYEKGNELTYFQLENKD